MKAWHGMAAFAVFVCHIAFGQAAPDIGVRTAPPAPSQAEQNTHMYRGSKIIGSAVRDMRERKIGEIKDILLDSRRGEIAYAVVNFGGAMGVGSKYHAIPWRALQPGDDGKSYVLQADRETLNQAPGFNRRQWPDLADGRWSAEVDRYWSRMVGRIGTDANRLPPETGAPASR